MNAWLRCRFFWMLSALCLPFPAEAAVPMGELPPIVNLQLPPGAEGAVVMRVHGAEPGAQIPGESQSAIDLGDVNGDGFDDLVFIAGGDEVLVLYGSATIPAVHNLATPPLPADATVIGFAAPGAVAVGDFDVDGFADIAIASRASAFMAILHGSVSLPATLSLAPGAIPPGATEVLLPPLETYPAEVSLAFGDVNADGYADLILGRPTFSPPSRAHAGEGHIVFGTAAPGALIDLSGGPVAGVAVRVAGNAENDRLGASIAAGDINGDGFDDVVLGAPGSEGIDVPDAGLAVLLPGRESFDAEIDLSSSFGVGGETRIFGEANAQFAASVAVNDLDGDGYDEIIATSGPPAAAEIRILYGKPAWPLAVLLNAAPGDLWVTRVLPPPAPGNAQLTVSSSDLNGDGFPGSLLGRTGLNGEPGMRSTYFVCGSPQRETLVTLSDTVGDVCTIQLISNAVADRFGTTAAGNGDWNRDGFSEAAVGAAWGDNPALAPAGNDAGYVAVLFGTSLQPEAQAREFFRGGDAPVRGMGGTLAPVSRTRLGFTGGTHAAASVRLTRNDAGISNRVQTANAIWEISSARTGWSAAQVAFQYTDQEINRLVESNLALYRADALTGPWEALATQALDPLRNEITATVQNLGFFAIAMGDPDLVPPVVESIEYQGPSPTNADEIEFVVRFSEPVTGFNAGSDVVVLRSGTSSSGVSIGGGPQEYTVTLSGVSGDGTVRLTINSISDIADLDGVGIGGNVTSQPVQIDNTPPAVALSSESGPAINGPVVIRLDVSETITSPVPASFVTQNATVANVTGSGLGYTVGLEPQSEGAVSISVPAGVLSDPAGNLGGASNVLQFNYDHTPPQISQVETAPGEASPGEVVEISFEVNEPLATLPSVLINGQAAVEAGKGAGAYYVFTYEVQVLDINGPASVSIAVVDLAGNEAAYTDPDAFTIFGATAPLPLSGRLSEVVAAAIVAFAFACWVRRAGRASRPAAVE